MEQYRVSRSRVHELLARYLAEGDTAFEPRSKRRVRSPTRISDDVAELIAKIRDDLAGRGLDSGPSTICGTSSSTTP